MRDLNKIYGRRVQRYGEFPSSLLMQTRHWQKGRFRQKNLPTREDCQV